ILRLFAGNRSLPVGMRADREAPLTSSIPVIQDEGTRSGGGDADAKALYVAVVGDLVALRWQGKCLDDRVREFLSHCIVSALCPSARRQVMDAKCPMMS